MTGISEELTVLLQNLKISLDNCKQEYAGYPEGTVYRRGNGSGATYFHATSNNGSYENAVRKTIDVNSKLTRQLARKKYLAIAMARMSAEIELLDKVLTHLHDSDISEIIGKMPRAFRELPKEYFLEDQRTTSGGWKRTEDGLIIPDFLRKSAVNGVLTKSQISEIREIQQEWANMPYERNTKNLKSRKIMTSRGLSVRSKSEAMIAERLYHWNVPFRHDQVIHIGNRLVSPDFSFFSIISGEHYWEHGGLITNDDYTDYHKFKRRLYEGVGIVPWKNYIETFDEEDGSINMQTVDAEIQFKLLKRLQLS